MHHGISLVKGMLSKGQAFLSNNLKREAMRALDEASNEFTAMKLEIEAFKASSAEWSGRALVYEQESESLRKERDELRALVDATKPMSDTASLVPVAVVQTDTEETVVVSTVEPTPTE